MSMTISTTHFATPTFGRSTMRDPDVRQVNDAEVDRGNGTYHDIHDLMGSAWVKLQVMDLFLRLRIGGLSNLLHAYGKLQNIHKHAASSFH